MFLSPILVASIGMTHNENKVYKLNFTLRGRLRPNDDLRLRLSTVTESCHSKRVTCSHPFFRVY